MSTIRKAIAALVTGLLTWLTAVTMSPAEAVTAAEWVTLAGVVVAGFLTWLVPNQSKDDGNVPTEMTPLAARKENPL